MRKPSSRGLVVNRPKFSRTWGAPQTAQVPAVPVAPAPDVEWGDSSSSLTGAGVSAGADMVETQVRLKYLPWQREVRAALYGGVKTLVLACGARSGKDRGSNQMLIELPLSVALRRARERSELIPRVNVWLVAPTKKLYAQNWSELNELLPSELVVRRNRQDGEVLLKGGIRYAFKSADRPETLVSEGVDFLGITEACRVKSNLVWEESLLPRLSSPGRLGIAMVNGTPRSGKGHWFRRLWEKARVCEDGSMRQWNYPTSINPLMVSRLPALMRAMPERLYRSEILGLWPDEDEKPFRDSDVAALFVDGGGEPRPPYVTAVDIARWRDETWATRFASSVSPHGRGGVAPLPQVTSCLRMRGCKLPLQIERVAGFYRDAPGRVVIDSTGTGGEFFGDDLERALPGVRVRRYDFHGSRKEDLFDGLVVGVERRAFLVRRDLLRPEDAQELREQLELFECDVCDDGRVDYHGPEGNRDDGVTSLALGWYEAGYGRQLVNSFDYERHLESIF